MKMRFFLLLILSCLVVSCSTKKPDNGKVVILCTTGMIGDALRNICNDSAEVITLMGPGTDPHLYKPTKGDLDELTRADVIVANGLHLEGKMQDILEKLSSSRKVVFVSDGIDKSKLLYPSGKAGFPDPHIWFDVSMWKSAIQFTGEDLSSSDFSSVVSGKKLNTYLENLALLHKETAGEIAEIPQERRMLITAHDAFSYFGRAYNIEVKGLQGISTVSEYGLRDISSIIDVITTKRIPAVFIESSISERSIQAVIDGCRDRGFDVQLGGTLYSDALGPASTEASSYTGMVKSNVSTIVKALK